MPNSSWSCTHSNLPFCTLPHKSKSGTWGNLTIKPRLYSYGGGTAADSKYRESAAECRQIPQLTTTEPQVPVIQTDAEERSDQIHPTFQFQHASHLPKLTLPCFSGDLLCWQTFRDSFDAAVNQNPSQSGIQKLNYLRAQVDGMPPAPLQGCN